MSFENKPPGSSAEAESSKEVKKPISLPEWLTYQNPNRKIIDGLVQEVDRRYTSTSAAGYSIEWQRMRHDSGSSEVLAFLKQRMEGRPLVDLGGGFYDGLQKIAVSLGVSTYINVDKFAFTYPEKPNPFVDSFEEMAKQEGEDVDPSEMKDGETQLVHVKADLLDFVSRMPDNSTNFTINGIDLLILGSRPYHEALAKEVSRATFPGGLVFGCASPVLDYLEKSPSFREVRMPHLLDDRKYNQDDDFRNRIYEKIAADEEKK